MRIKVFRTVSGICRWRLGHARNGQHVSADYGIEIHAGLVIDVRLVTCEIVKQRIKEMLLNIIGIETSRPE